MRRGRAIQNLVLVLVLLLAAGLRFYGLGTQSLWNDEGTSAALANYLDVIKQKVQKLAKICEEFAGDLARAITDHKNGDFQGKRYFGEGIRR